MFQVVVEGFPKPFYVGDDEAMAQAIYRSQCELSFNIESSLSPGMSVRLLCDDVCIHEQHTAIDVVFNDPHTD